MQPEEVEEPKNRTKQHPQYLNLVEMLHNQVSYTPKRRAEQIRPAQVRRSRPGLFNHEGELHNSPFQQQPWPNITHCNLSLRLPSPPLPSPPLLPQQSSSNRQTPKTNKKTPHQIKVSNVQSRLSCHVMSCHVHTMMHKLCHLVW
jgi:hypothetical protein